MQSSLCLARRTTANITIKIWHLKTCLPHFWVLQTTKRGVVVKKSNEQQVLKCTHRSLFNDSVEHYNSFGTLLPYHQPEMTTGIPQRALGKQKNEMYTEKKNPVVIKSSQNIKVKSCTVFFHWSTDLFNVYLCWHWHLHCLYDTVPEKECKLFGLLPPWLNLHWCSHFQSFQVLPDCDHLKPDEEIMEQLQITKTSFVIIH